MLTISHNSNQSRGARFAGLDSAGAPLTREQAAYRTAHEPLVEIMQFKGNSECRTGLGTEDEFCNFEKYDLRPLCSGPSAPWPASGLNRIPGAASLTRSGAGRPSAPAATASSYVSSAAGISLPDWSRGQSLPNWDIAMEYRWARAPTGNRADHTGTRLVVTDLVHE